MIRASCFKSHCPLCHGRTDSNGMDNSPRYLQPTSSSRHRRSLRIKETQLKTHSKRTPSKNENALEKDSAKPRLSFLNLPVEVRLLIYSYCIKWHNEDGQSLQGTTICGWVEGGGFHSDQKPSWKYSPGFTLLATGRFPPALFLVCKAINKEATPEIYGSITFVLQDVELRDRAKLSYWLRTHPVRLSRHLALTIHIAEEWFRPSTERKIMSEDMRFLGGIINQMPHLGRLSIYISVDLIGPNLRIDQALNRSLLPVFTLYATIRSKDLVITKVEDPRFKQLAGEAASVLSLLKRRGIRAESVEPIKAGLDWRPDGRNFTWHLLVKAPW